MRYNNQLTLPFMQESEGETQLLLQQGTEASNTSPCTKARPQWRSMRQSEQNFVEPPCTDPYARWCGRGRSARTAPIPILAVKHGSACATPGWRAQWIPHAIGVQVWGIPPA